MGGEVADLLFEFRDARGGEGLERVGGREGFGGGAVDDALADGAAFEVGEGFLFFFDLAIGEGSDGLDGLAVAFAAALEHFAAPVGEVLVDAVEEFLGALEFFEGFEVFAFLGEGFAVLGEEPSFEEGFGGVELSGCGGWWGGIGRGLGAQVFQPGCEGDGAEQESGAGSQPVHRVGTLGNGEGFGNGRFQRV